MVAMKARKTDCQLAGAMENWKVSISVGQMVNVLVQWKDKPMVGSLDISLLVHMLVPMKDERLVAWTVRLSACPKAAKKVKPMVAYWVETKAAMLVQRKVAKKDNQMVRRKGLWMVLRTGVVMDSVPVEWLDGERVERKAIRVEDRTVVTMARKTAEKLVGAKDAEKVHVLVAKSDSSLDFDWARWMVDEKAVQRV